MIEAGSRRLNPFEPAAADHFGPGNGDFGVAAEDVGFEELRRDSLLASIDHVVPASAQYR